jgi:hypothetical protein
MTNAFSSEARGLATRSRSVILICIGLWVLWGFGYETVGLRLSIDLNGLIVDRQTIPRNWSTHGTGTVYTVRADNGTMQRYVAGATDGSLPRDIPLGARIAKRKWELSYTLNGTRVLNFPIVFMPSF